MAKLPISELKLATGISGTTLKTQAGITGAVTDDIKLSEFKLSSITGVTPSDTTISYNGTFSITVNTTGDQQYFDKIKTVESNYISTFTDSHLTLVSESNNTKTFKNSYNPSIGNTSVSTIIYTKFNDKSFNEDAVNYNTNFPTTITLYSPPSPSVSFVSSTKPPRPCCGVSARWTSCCSATITVYVTSPTYQGITASSNTVYLNNVATATIAGSGNVTLYNLIGSTTYSIKVINNFNCSSNTISVTTPAYT
jgi:hypothetical protein